MAFKFSLAAVLKYREELEKREERALEQRREALAAIEKKLAELESQQQQLIHTRASLLQRGTLADDLHYCEQQLLRLTVSHAQLRSEAATALLAYEQQMQLFLAARQKREILDELKSTQKDAHMVRQNRREQQQIDEMFNRRGQQDK